MARKARVEFAGAIYHVLDRGDRREPITRDDRDRERFLVTLRETCERSRWRVHALVLMGHHYHLRLKTPQPNPVAGMPWLPARSQGPHGNERTTAEQAPPTQSWSKLQQSKAPVGAIPGRRCN